MSALENLEPKSVFAWFQAINNIPRGSGNEKQLSDFIVRFAKERNLWVTQDGDYNLIIKKPAAQGYESAPTVIIQGHLDMINEKNHDVEHDFEKDGIDMIVDGDFIRARGTTLGADDGIAVAYAMALLAADDIAHPALEVVFTTNEEVGLLGAASIDVSPLCGKMLINMDSEEEDVLWVSCAGGIKTHSVFKKEFNEEVPSDTVPLAVMVKGLKGGHSGMDIDKKRGNSIKIMARLVREIFEHTNAELADISGGLKDNAIPRECLAEFSVPRAEVSDFKKIVAAMEAALQNEHRKTEPDLCINIEERSERNKKLLTKLFAEKIVTALLLLPNGIEAMSADIEGLVETSNNIGVVASTEDKIEIICAVRSSVESKKNELTYRIERLTDVLGGIFSATGGYPSWEYKPDSRLRDMFAETYEELFGKRPECKAVHAGLECGYFAEKIQDLDMVSFGPNMFDIHTPDERLSISSAKRVWEYVLRFLEKLK